MGCHCVSSTAAALAASPHPVPNQLSPRSPWDQASTPRPFLTTTATSATAPPPVMPLRSYANQVLPSIPASASVTWPLDPSAPLNSHNHIYIRVLASIHSKDLVWPGL